MFETSLINRDKAMANQDMMVRPVFNGWRIAGWGIAAALLLLPLVAMQFTTDVEWTGNDFLIMGTMIGSIGLAFEFLVRKSNRLAYRVAAGVTLMTTFLLIWINLAAGVIGSENNPANLMYLGVFAVGISGAFVARFEAAAMGRALGATACVHGLIALIALAAGLGAAEPPGSVKVFMLNGFFVALWSFAAWLFAKAGGEGAS